VKMSRLTRRVLNGLALTFVILALAVLSRTSTSDRLARPNPSASLIQSSSGLTASDARNDMALYGADLATVDRNARDFKLLEQVEWKGRPGSTSQTATVFGDPAKPGAYVTLLKRGPDDWSEPHAHPNDRYITVLKGTMLIGAGAKADRKNTVAVGPGGMIRDIAGQMHYDGTGPDGLIIEIIGMGPTGRIDPNAK
jgi:hypothetical protein